MPAVSPFSSIRPSETSQEELGQWHLDLELGFDSDRRGKVSHWIGSENDGICLFFTRKSDPWAFGARKFDQPCMGACWKARKAKKPGETLEM